MLCLSNRSNDAYEKNYYSKIFEVDSLLNKENKGFLFLNSLLVDDLGNKVSIKTNKKTAVILWAKFLGKKRNKKHIYSANQDIKDSDLPINIIYLNIDAMDFWK